MGGDGGTIGSTRAYLRGAGKACHTADHPSSARERAKKAVMADDVVGRAKLALSTCAVSGDSLDFSPGATMMSSAANTNTTIVACPYGRLYKRERILEALLSRARGVGGGDDDRDANEHARAALGSISHIRGMKDLHSVRFHVVAVSNNGKNESYYTPTCPITGSDIGSGKVPSYVIVRSSTKMSSKENGGEDDEAARGPNVLSERAIKEMGVQGLQTEFGPFEEKDMILLAPPLTGGVFDEIKRKWEERVEIERVTKLEKKKDKKRKRGVATLNTSLEIDSAPTKSDYTDTNINTSDISRTINDTKKKSTSSSSAVDEARSTVQSAISHNPVLLNLFGAGKDDKMQKTTEKEKRDALFTRNC